MYMYVNKTVVCILGFDSDLSSQQVFYDLHVRMILKQTILTIAGVIGYEV